MGVNPSLIINKGIYIQHVDGGLYTKENWSNKGYSKMSNRMWTSTRNTKFSYSWYYDINIQGDHLDTGSRGSSHYVRPFTELIL